MDNEIFATSIIFRYLFNYVVVVTVNDIGQLDEINQLFLPNMRNKLMWFYQEVDEPESVAQPEPTKPGPSRTAAGTSNSSKTPQGDCQAFIVGIAPSSQASI